MSLEQELPIAQLSGQKNAKRGRAANVRAKLSYAGATVTGFAALADVGYSLAADSTTEKAAGVVAGVIFVAGTLAGGISGRKHGKESAHFRRAVNVERRSRTRKGKKNVAPADRVFAEYYVNGNGRHR